MTTSPNWEQNSAADLAVYFECHQAAEQAIGKLLDSSIEAFEPFHDWEEIWPDQCQHALTSLTALQKAIKVLESVYEGSVPPTIWSHWLTMIFDWSHIDHLIEEEIIIVLVSYRKHGRSTEEIYLRKRLHLAKKHDEMIIVIRNAIAKFPTWREEVIKSQESIYGKAASKSKRRQQPPHHTIFEEDTIIVDADAEAPVAKILQLKPGKEGRHED